MKMHKTILTLLLTMLAVIGTTGRWPTRTGRTVIWIT